ncbi:protein translocase subunit SecF [Aquisalimonas asiatica]|uniref:Protein-export membrane protein SecF n=1 Tax=Aquisalimonas asiatica TaxID=406100 RepID=A0A1H8PLT6_9GAMM|nr:protein translocase subunit SecF [Aquisalimonas asiatica]SEO42697.1 protein translocase subunit secF [Aquisalimonas asiatica]
MWLFNKTPNLDFMSRRRWAGLASLIMLSLAVAIIAVRGLNFGIDFTGGTIVEVGFQESVDLSEVRRTMDEGGYEEAVVQHFGTARDVMIRLGPRDEEDADALSNRVLDTLEERFPEVELRRVEFVGPQVGEELTEQGALAMLGALGCILLYVAFRFEYRFAAGSVAALVHDITLVVGILSLFQITFDLTVLAALLAVIGYSLNDTIVVFDRIRENFLRMRKGSTEEVMNASINQTLSRTLVTSFTTLLVVLSLYFVGGEVISGFAFTLLLGVLVGTYSSIFVASASALAMGVTKYDLQPPAKEGEDQEEEGEGARP